MNLREFTAFHRPNLELNEAKHGLILNALALAESEKPVELSYWTLGNPGECAIRVGSHSIVLGALGQSQCRTLAELADETDYPGVIGPGLTARWLVDRAQELGRSFAEAEPEQIYSISDPPRYPGVLGQARLATGKDAELVGNWLTAFFQEAVPCDRLPPRDELELAAGEGRFMFWIDEGRPVSMAGIARRLRDSAAITGVYTPPELRGHGYAGSVTAATVERIYAEGRKTACLYTDLRNSASNRCYVKIGFRPVGRSLHIHRRT
jgi:GNAT superfamily N-acetyltransferase